MSDLLTDEQIDALDKYGDEPEIFAHARAANAEIARLRNDVHGYMNQVGVLTSRLEEAREAGRKVVDIWLKTDDSYVNFGSLMLDLQEAVIADTKQSKDAAHHHRQRGRDSDMKCPSCGALAEVPGHYSWCEIQPPDSASEEQDEGRTPDQSWIVALHNLRICADELHRIGHGGEARMIEDAVNRIVAFRQHIAARARAEVVEKIEMRRDEIIDMRPADRPPTIRTLNGIIRALVSPTTEEE